MEEVDEQRREVRTPARGSPTFPVSRRPRSPARHRACSRERRSRSRSSRQSRGRPSRCSPEQLDHRSRDELSRRTRSRSNRRPSSDQLSNPVRPDIDRTVCLYALRDSVRSGHVSRSRSRSRLTDHSRGRSRERSHNQNRCRDRSRSHGCDPNRNRYVSSRHTDFNQRPRTAVDSVTGLPSRRHSANRWESQVENDGLPKPNSGLAKLVDTLLAANINSLNKFSSMNNTVPEFDPSRREQTMAMWLHKVNECAIIYGWTESQIVHFALPKLKGLAQRWYESLPSVLHTWEVWQQKLLSAFPSEENYGQMLSEMLAKRARFTDSLEDYFYNKVALLNRCGITGKRAVECIIYGKDSRLNNTYEHKDLPVLKGFGNSTIKAIGRKLVHLIVDDVEADVELFIVPDNVMNVPLLIGQSFTEQPHVIIRKTSESLEVYSLSQNVENSH